MRRLTHAEMLADLIEELPWGAKRKLTLSDAWQIVPRSLDKPGRLPKAYDGLKKALSSRRNPYPVKELGKCLTRWWARMHRRELSARDIDRLFDGIPDAEAREVLARFAAECHRASRGST